jgi:hypothetical protein
MDELVPGLVGGKSRLLTKRGEAKGEGGRPEQKLAKRQRGKLTDRTNEAQVQESLERI